MEGVEMLDGNFWQFAMSHTSHFDWKSFLMKPIMLQLTSIFIFISLYGPLFRSSNQNHPKAYGFSSIGDVTHVTQARCDMCDILKNMLIPLEMHDSELFL